MSFEYDMTRRANQEGAGNATKSNASHRGEQRSIHDVQHTRAQAPPTSARPPAARAPLACLRQHSRWPLHCVPRGILQSHGGRQGTRWSKASAVAITETARQLAALPRRLLGGTSERGRCVATRAAAAAGAGSAAAGTTLPTVCTTPAPARTSPILLLVVCMQAVRPRAVAAQLAGWGAGLVERLALAPLHRVGGEVGDQQRGNSTRVGHSKRAEGAGELNRCPWNAAAMHAVPSLLRSTPACCRPIHPSLPAATPSLQGVSGSAPPAAACRSRTHLRLPAAPPTSACRRPRLPLSGSASTTLCRPPAEMLITRHRSGPPGSLSSTGEMQSFCRPVPSLRVGRGGWASGWLDMGGTTTRHEHVRSPPCSCRSFAATPCGRPTPAQPTTNS